MKKTLLYFKRFALGFLFFIITYLLAVVLLPCIPVNSDPRNQEDIDIYILTNGMHTDIVCPVKSEIFDWSTLVPFADTKSKRTDYTYIALGWGDKGFYLDTPEWKDLKISTAFKAAFWLGDSAIHATYYPSITEGVDCKKITISKEQYQDLISYVKNSFQLKNQQAQLIKTDAVYGDNDAFYEAKRTYSLFYTCNTWTNNALKEIKQKAALWTATQQGIFKQYEN